MTISEDVTVERPVRQDVTRNRARLLKAADELVAERGLDISFNGLAHRSGVGVGTVYRHFADKGALVTACSIVGWSRSSRS
ncbi:MAG: TetR/AcrR family transcriptional regulator [Nakamurella sp.]